MALVTIADLKYGKQGGRRAQFYRLTAPANGDTLATGLSRVDQVVPVPLTAFAAADAVSVSIDGGTVTFNVIGTARDLAVEVLGV